MEYYSAIEKNEIMPFAEIWSDLEIVRASLVAQMVKKICLRCRRPALILGSGRSPREGTGYPLQYFFLENSMELGRLYIVHGVTKSWT